MPHFSRPEILMEAAGVKIVTSLPEEDVRTLAPGKIVLKMQKINGMPDKSCGFHLTKSKWDPYPWISYVENHSPADLAGLKAGDCLLSVDGTDLLGLKVKDIAMLIRSEEGVVSEVNFSVWRYSHHGEEQNIGLALKGPLPDVAGNLANALSGMVRALECPICLESAVPPVSQCVHGHILCVVCRPKTTHCPVCRIRLGQGRCLLADKLHRVLRETFNTSSDETTTDRNVASDHCDLRDQLFGKAHKKREKRRSPVVTSNCSALKPRQFLLARLLLGGREKAASVDNLTRMSEASAEDATTPSESMATESLRVRFSANDRAKSASTGELSKESAAGINDSPSRISNKLNREPSVTNTASQQSLSLPQTPIWGGSLDSVSCVQLACPLLQSCREVTTPDTLLEHIKSHSVPQIHFYSGSARMPLPFPFGRDALYVLHYGDDMFFLQCGEERAWMTYPVKITPASNAWEWTLHAWGDNGTEIKVRKYVACLEDPVTLSSQHIALLPDALSLKIVNIQISEHRTQDRLCI